MFRRSISVLAVFSALLVGFVAAAPAQAQAQAGESFRVTFTNQTDGQPMTPPVIAIHDAETIRLFEPGQPAIAGVQAIAENGNNDPLVALATSQPAAVVSAAGVAVPEPAGPIFPGMSASIDLSGARSGHALSLVSMVVCTNDGFNGLDSVALPEAGQTVVFPVAAYDAGTEVNVLDADYWVPPCGGSGENLHDDENGVITPHPGQAGVGPFNFAAGDTVALVTIENLAPAPAPVATEYQIEFTNVSEGQPMTPPVVAVHDPAQIRLFSIGNAAIEGIQQIAENGNNDPLVALALAQPPNVISAAGVAVPNPPGPLLPGDSSTISLSTTQTDHRFSFAAMVVCTNDGFVGLDSIDLPAAGTSATYDIAAFDAGTEVNMLNADYWVPPCGGSGENLHEDENGVVAVHPGQTGVGPFNFASGETLMTVTITAGSAAAPTVAFAPNVVPGRIQAEGFDTDGEGQAWNDNEATNRGNSTIRDGEGVDIFEIVNSGAGPIIGSTRGGEWTEYTIDVPAGGTYELTARVASGFSSPGFIRARVDGVEVGTVDGDTGDWFEWDVRSFGSVDLAAGTHVVRLAWNGGGQVNLDWFEVNLAGDLPTIADIATGDDQLSTLVSAVSAASDAGPIDLLSVLADPDADLTVFAPTNDAFDRFGPALDYLLDDPGGVLSEVLAYHVLGTSEYGADLVAQESAVALNGQSVRISVRPGGVFINDAKVLIRDIPAANGIVHVIDGVLVPEPPTTCRGLHQQAEDGRLSGNFVTQSPASSAAGGAYIEAPDGSGRADGDDYAEFCVNVRRGGVYRIDATIRAFDNTDDSFFVSVDGGPKVLFDTTISSTWTRDSVSARGIADPVRWRLEPGEHIVRFYQRDNGTQLDEFRLVRGPGRPTNLR